jgi:hypothetical protein
MNEIRRRCCPKMRGKNVCNNLKFTVEARLLVTEEEGKIDVGIL